MKRKTLRFLIGAFIALALPFFLGINCCCFAQFDFAQSHQEEKNNSCHTESNSQKEDPSNHCVCVKQVVLLEENSNLAIIQGSPTAKILSALFICSISLEMKNPSINFAFHDSSPPLKLASPYLSYILDHAPPA